MYRSMVHIFLQFSSGRFSPLSRTLRLFHRGLNHLNCRFNDEGNTGAELRQKSRLHRKSSRNDQSPYVVFIYCKHIGPSQCELHTCQFLPCDAEMSSGVFLNFGISSVQTIGNTMFLSGYERCRWQWACGEAGSATIPLVWTPDYRSLESRLSQTQYPCLDMEDVEGNGLVARLGAQPSL